MLPSHSCGALYKIYIYIYSPWQSFTAPGACIADLAQNCNNWPELGETTRPSPVWVHSVLWSRKHDSTPAFWQHITSSQRLWEQAICVSVYVLNTLHYRVRFQEQYPAWENIEWVSGCLTAHEHKAISCRYMVWNIHCNLKAIWNT